MAILLAFASVIVLVAIIAVVDCWDEARERKARVDRLNAESQAWHRKRLAEWERSNGR
jgi:hypothetical protein